MCLILLTKFGAVVSFFAMRDPVIAGLYVIQGVFWLSILVVRLATAPQTRGSVTPKPSLN